MKYKYRKKYFINGVIVFGILVVLAFLGISSVVNKDSQKEQQNELLDGESSQQDVVEANENVYGWEGFLDISLIPTSIENVGAQKSKLYVQSDKGYFFLPSYWRKDELKISFNSEEYGIQIDGHDVSSNESVSLTDNTTYELIVTDSNSIEKTYALTVMQSQNLPTIFISCFG